MENITEILEDTVGEILEMKYFKLIEESEEVEDSVRAVRELSSNIFDNKDIPKEVKRQIEDYKDLSGFVEIELQKFIYKEGIKDCIKLLKLIGILWWHGKNRVF